MLKQRHGIDNRIVGQLQVQEKLQKEREEAATPQNR